MYDLNEILSFTQIVKSGGIHAASLDFGTPKSTLSRHLQLLEKRLGLVLVHRTTRKIKLTSEGEKFFYRTQLLFKELKEAEQEVKENRTGLSGLIRLTAPSDFGTHTLAQPISEFCKQYPNISIDLVLTDKYIDIIKNGIDLAIRIGSLQNSNFKFKKISIAPMSLVASPDYLNSNLRPSSIEELKKLNCILFTPQNRLLPWVLTNGINKIKFSPVEIKYKASNLSTCLEFAKQGLGVTLAPQSMQKISISTGELEKVLPYWHSEVQHLSLVWPYQIEPPNRVRLLIDYLTEKLKS